MRQRTKNADSNFFNHVYQITRLVPPGKVATYGQIAELVSHRGAARTVGWALHSLPNRINDVPWHRVINSRGRVSSGRGHSGQEQRAMLEAEGIVFDKQGCVDFSIYLWNSPPQVTFQEPERGR